LTRSGPSSRGGVPAVAAGVTLVLAEAPLETVPRELWGHPSVARHARKRGRPPRDILLDAAMHHQAMRRLPGREYRGRPDIVHVTLLVALDAPLCRHTGCRLLVHTVGDLVIEVDPSTRLPRNYLRFTGLMEQLLREGRIPPGAEKPLMAARPTGLDELLEELHRAAGEPLLVAGSGGRTEPLEELAGTAMERPVLVPATPRAEPTPQLLARLEPVVPRGLEGSEPWTIVSRLQAELERLILRRGTGAPVER